MDGVRVIECLGAWIHVGTPVDLKRPGADGWPDLTQDFAVRLVSGHWATPLLLADAEPAVGDWVWVVGQESGQRPGNERLYAGQMITVANGAYILKQHDPFDAHGFSGGPVVNARGEVVGNVLAGAPGFVAGATVGTLRRRLAENGIQVD
jgi:Trypsin-like peptidase domain